ncbi:D-alanyl-D-alanine carboxypeptidase [Luteolibacter ambystomatis]|uniref:D-alanyl-D-alanine carboxypeptidase n=1 Tax=Luteolibacter ambystomatis TaxID=2824561 RepID=A0A975PGB7_9BACT|nr:D-alanyl-D-alanine carboxypeptidase family protein [Luteolibacter ambystomatis]QUE52435.1 D-alanyl-D-alanine carboxypeptidase [Luteolibacter ambystomatis]
MPRPLLVRSAALLLSVLPTACAVAPPLRSTSRNTANSPQAPAVIVEQPHSFGSVPPTAPPAIAAESAIVIDADSGRVLYAKNADSPRQVASTQKIITALCVLDAGNMDKQVVIEKIDVACEPTRLDMKPGDSYSRRDLLKALMVKSCNDVARALARDVGGSVEGFSDLMNRKAASLGMRNSHFVNPNGLPSTAQYSTARDMAIAARYAYRSPLLRSYVATKAFEFQFADGRTRLLENTNRILKSVPYCNGMKTGTTDAAGRCLVCTGSLNGRSTIVVVLKSTTPFIWKDSEKLLRWSLER